MAGKFFAAVRIMAVSGALVAVPLGAVAQDSKPVAPDNSKVNKADRKTDTPKADQAKNTKSDRETMREIRRAVVKDKSLSSYGHNVKIIAENGKVTLRGPVHSEDEKKSIEAKAAEIAGDSNVTSELTVKGR
jgi:osmotically-inducible protein OsmY